MMRGPLNRGHPTIPVIVRCVCLGREMPHRASETSSQKLIPIPQFMPPGHSLCSCVFSAFSFTWENPEVGGEENLFGSFKSYGDHSCGKKTLEIRGLNPSIGGSVRVEISPRGSLRFVWKVHSSIIMISLLLLLLL